VSTTTGHIKAIITAENAQYMAKSRETRADSKALKAEVERNKPEIDADEKPFVAAVARAEAAQASLSDKVKKTVADLQAQVSKAGDAEATAIGKVRVAQAALDELRDGDSTPSALQLAVADERLAVAQRTLVQAQQRTETLTGRLAEANTKLAATTEDVVAVTDDAAKSHDTAAKSADKHGSAIGKLALAFVVANAAMLAGGLAAGAAVGVLPVMAVAAAAFLLSANEKVADSFSGLATTVVTDARAMAAPLQDDLVQASSDLAATWIKLRPAIHGLFEESQPAVRELTRGVSEFAENAVPGMLTAVSRSEPVMVGWRKFLSDTGAGFGAFFRNVSTDSESTGRDIAAFGSVIRTVLAAAGTVLQQLSTAFAPYAEDFARVFQKLMDVVTRLTAGALPVLASSLGIALDVLEALLNVLEPISGFLGTTVGVVLSAAAAWKVYGAAIALVARVPLTGALTASVAAAAPAGGILSRLGLGAAGAASGTGALAGALSPLGIALAATGLIMGAYLLEQQGINKGADAFVQGVTKGGDAAKKAVDDYSALKKGLADLTAQRDAYLAQQGATPDDASLGAMNDQIAGQTEKVDRAREKWDEYLASVGPVEQAQAKLNLAIAQFGKDSPQATSAAAAYRGEVSKQEAASRAAADAVKTHTDRINENLAMQLHAVGASLDYDSALLSLEQSQKALTQAVKDHGPASLEARTADNQYQQQLLATVDAIGVKVKAENASKTAAEVSTAVTQAQYGEILRLALAAGDDAPAGLQKMIAGMDGAALAAMGVTVKVKDTGEAIVTMPDGKEIVINGDNADAMKKIEQVNAATVLSKTLWIDAVIRNDARVAMSNGVGGMNDGGWVPGNGPDADDRMVPVTSKEFVVNRRAAAKWGPFLEMINSANGGDIRLPESGLKTGALGMADPSIPRARIPASSSSSAAGVGGSMAASSGRTVIIESLHMHQVRTLPTAEELQNVLHDVEVQYAS
jgi:hypothetical protein